jgi:hypothetical protein
MFFTARLLRGDSLHALDRHQGRRAPALVAADSPGDWLGAGGRGAPSGVCVVRVSHPDRAGAGALP